MQILVIGTGYVGLVVGACMAESGNDVTCADIDAAKIDLLRQNILPIYEPGLDELVRRNQEQGRLRFTTDVADAAAMATVVFLAVGTPPDEDGSADLRHVLAAAETVARNLTRETVLITQVDRAGGNGGAGRPGGREACPRAIPHLQQPGVPQGR